VEVAIIISTISLLIFLDNDHFLISIAWILGKERMKVTSAEDWPSLLVGFEIILFYVLQRKKYLPQRRRFHAIFLKGSFIDPSGMNAVALEGLLRKDELEKFSEAVNVFPDLPVYCCQ